MSIDTSTIDNSYLLFIRSKEVEQITTNFNSNMKINLEASISRNNALQDIHLQLSSCEIPVTFYNFSSNLNNIKLYLDGSSSLVLTEQHYDIYDLIDEITNASFPYSATFDDKKNKVTLTNTDSTSHTINFSQEDSRNLAKALGFNREDQVVGSGASITSDDVINLNTIHSIFVHTNLPVSNVITTTNNNYRNIIQKIPITKPFGDIINYNPYQSSLFSTIINTNEINNFTLSLRDQNDNLIQFNDVNYEISLLFEIHNVDTLKEIPEPRGGGRRSMMSQAITPIEPPNIAKTISPRPPTPPVRGMLPVTPHIQQVTPQQLGQYSQPKPEPLAPIIEEELNKDKILDDKQNDKLQTAILDSVLDDIL